MKTLACTLLLLAISTWARPADVAENDGEIVYRNNCGRCHTAIHAFSPRMLATVVRHMQVKASLTDNERSAVLQYLLQAVPAVKPPPAKKVKQ